MSQSSTMKTRSTNRDPFSKIPIPKSFYHPSQKKQLSKTEKKIALSPRRERPVSPEDELFLRGNKIVSSLTPPTREKSDERFDESWPSSERPSYSSLSGCNNESSTSGFDTVYDNRKDRETLSREKTSTSYKPTTYLDQNTGPVLHRYIDRFRNSQPTSREERKQEAPVNHKEFWWLSSNQMAPSDSSTPKSERQQSKLFAEKTSSKLYHDKSRSTRGGFQSEVDIDLESKELQDKADRILAESESTVCSIETYDGEPAISTDGLASTVSHTSTSSTNDQPPPSRPHPISHHAASHNPTRAQPSAYKDRDQYQTMTIPTALPTTTRPEDDILYQWRLQRKMEVARMGAAEMMAKNNSEVSSRLKEIQHRLLTRDLSTASTSQSNYYFTPNPATTSSNIQLQPPSRQPEQSTSSSTRPNQPGGYRPTIASPSLPVDTNHHDDPVHPHLHLMCDVLPCPHSQQHQKQFQKLYDDPSEGQSAAYKQFLDAEKPITDGQTQSQGTTAQYGHTTRQTMMERKTLDEQGQQSSVEDLGQDRSINVAAEPDARFSKYSDDKHVRWAEHDENGSGSRHTKNPDWFKGETKSWRNQSRGVDSLSDQEGGTSQTRVKRNKSDLENNDEERTFKKKGEGNRRLEDIDSESDIDQIFKSRGDTSDTAIDRDGGNVRRRTSETGSEESHTVRDRHAHQEKEHSHSERIRTKSTMKVEKQYSDKNSDKNRHSSLYNLQDQSEEDDGSYSEKTLHKGQLGSNEYRSKDNQSSLKEQGYKESSRTTKHLQPKFASSPAKPYTPVKSAIGQTVKDFLFTTSSGSVMSSVESMSSLMSSAVPERLADEDKEGKNIDKEGEKIIKQEDEYISDGEYPDDQLLMLLRQQRDNIERRLGEIDKIL